MGEPKGGLFPPLGRLNPKMANRHPWERFPSLCLQTFGDLSNLQAIGYPFFRAPLARSLADC